MKSLNRSSTASAPRTGTTPRTGTRRRLLATGALFCIGIMPLSACSLFNPPLERDESVHAIFDAEQDIVKMPLDDYLYYERTNYEYTAFQIAISNASPNTGRTTPSRLPILKAHPAVIWDESTVPGTSSTPRSTVFRSETPTTQPPPSPITRGRA